MFREVVYEGSKTVHVPTMKRHHGRPLCRHPEVYGNEMQKCRQYAPMGKRLF